MRRVLLTSSVAVCALLASLPVASAFLEQLPLIQAKIAAYQEGSAEDLRGLAESLGEAGAARFTDVAARDWFAVFVHPVSSWGIVSGYLDADGESLGLFRPGNPVTMAEALKMTLRAAGVDEQECQRPSMAPGARDHWATLFVSCAEEKEMRLIQTSVLDLNRPLRRSEFLALVHDAFGDNVPPFYTGFADVRGHRHEADIAYAALRGIVAGDTDTAGKLTGSFRPDANLTRAEAAKILLLRLTLRTREAAAASVLPLP